MYNWKNKKLKNGYVQLKKKIIIKTKKLKRLCTIPKVKNGYVQLQMKVFQFQT